MAAIASVANASSLRAIAREEKPEGAPGRDEFQETSPDKNKRGYEFAHDAVTLLDNFTRVTARAGQGITLTTRLAGLQPGGLGPVLGLIGGTYDVAEGASRAKQSAIDHNLRGAVLGNLQVVQGISTYAAVLGPLFGSPLAGQVAAGVAAGAFLGRLGYQAFGKLKDSLEGEPELGGMAGTEAARAARMGKTPQQVRQENEKVSRSLLKAVSGEEEGEAAETRSRSRTFEKAFAFSHATDRFFRGLGGLGSFWTVVDGLRGIQPGGLFGIMGILGATYTIYDGARATKAAAINRNQGGTIQGSLQTIQGVATMATLMGLGRPAALVAAGAWAARLGYQIYQTMRRVEPPKESGTNEGGKPSAAAREDGKVEPKAA